MTSILSKYLSTPVDSPEHRQLRAELWLGGPSHACRYYLSVLTRRDFFDANDDEFLAGVREYVVAHSCPDASQFCVTQYHLQFVLPFLKQQYYELAEDEDDAGNLSNEEYALSLLVQHPDWTDNQIVDAVGTTEKQMKHWPTFVAARAAQTHYRNRCEGWY